MDEAVCLEEPGGHEEEVRRLLLVRAGGPGPADHAAERRLPFHRQLVAREMGRCEREGPLERGEPRLLRLSRQAVHQVDADIREPRARSPPQARFSRPRRRVPPPQEGKLPVVEGLDAEAQTVDAEGPQGRRRGPSRSSGFASIVISASAEKRKCSRRVRNRAAICPSSRTGGRAAADIEGVERAEPLFVEGRSPARGPRATHLPRPAPSPSRSRSRRIWCGRRGRARRGRAGDAAGARSATPHRSSSGPP